MPERIEVRQITLRERVTKTAALKTRTGAINNNKANNNNNNNNKKVKKQPRRRTKRRIRNNNKPQAPEAILVGHESRVWDVVSDRSGRWLASSSGDSAVCLWDCWSCLEKQNSKRARARRQALSSSSSSSSSGLRQRGVFEAPTTNERGGATDADLCTVSKIETGHQGDIYGLAFHSDLEQLATAGYDKTVRLVDLATQQVVKVLQGHTGAVTHVAFNSNGLTLSSSKDSSIRLWDSRSGACVRTLSQGIGEITSLALSKSSLQVLSSGKVFIVLLYLFVCLFFFFSDVFCLVFQDNCNRLWDLRSSKCVLRFKGHQNNSRNFIRSVFGPRDAFVFGGSEDGRVYVWDSLTGEVLARLRGHQGPVFHPVWSDAQSLLATCSDDGTVKTFY